MEFLKKLNDQPSGLNTVLPAGKDVAEFLQDVTLPEGIQKYRALNVSPRMLIHRPEDFGPGQGPPRHLCSKKRGDFFKTFFLLIFRALLVNSLGIKNSAFWTGSLTLTSTRGAGGGMELTLENDRETASWIVGSGCIEKSKNT